MECIFNTLTSILEGATQREALWIKDKKGTAVKAREATRKYDAEASHKTNPTQGGERGKERSKCGVALAPGLAHNYPYDAQPGGLDSALGWDMMPWPNGPLGALFGPKWPFGGFEAP